MKFLSEIEEIIEYCKNNNFTLSSILINPDWFNELLQELQNNKIICNRHIDYYEIRINGQGIKIFPPINWKKINNDWFFHF